MADKGKGVLIEVEDDSDNEEGGKKEEEDDENKAEILKMLEQSDHEIAKKLQEEEYAKQQQQPQVCNPTPIAFAYPDDRCNPDFPTLVPDQYPNIPALQMNPILWRRFIPKDSLCAIITLTATDVLSPDAYMTIGINEAMAISGNWDLRENVPEGDFPMALFVYDMENLNYNMMLRYFNFGIQKNDEGVFCITGKGWDAFLSKHSLRTGDVLQIFRTYDPRVFDDHYFVFKLIKKPKPQQAGIHIQERKPDDKKDDGIIKPKPQQAGIRIQERKPDDDKKDPGINIGDLETIQQQRYAQKGKAKVVEETLPPPPPPPPLPPLSSPGNEASDNDEVTLQENLLKEIEDQDLLFALQLQAAEYAAEGLSPPIYPVYPQTTLPDSKVDAENDPDLAFLSDDDLPADYLPSLKMSPKSWRRNIPMYCLRISRTLSEEDVREPCSYLRFDRGKARTISDEWDLEEGTQLHMPMLVYDGDEETYRMELRDLSSTGGGFGVSGEWNKFVHKHGLKAGDQLSIYKTFDPRVQKDHYFVFKVFKVPSRAAPPPPPDTSLTLCSSGAGETSQRKRADDDKKDRDDSPKKQKLEDDSGDGSVPH